MAQTKRFYSMEQAGSTVDIEIYGDITSWEWLDSDMSSYTLAQRIKGLSDVDTINVGINSYGGEVSEGLAIYNALKNSPAKVVTRCDGFACSAASVVFAAGDERLMNDASLLMIHNAWTFASGDANALRKQADDLDKITSASVRAYMAIVSIEEDELKQLMDSETWIDADEAVRMGFATSKVDTEEEEKASQSVRKKVLQMIRNPYQLEDPDDPNKEPGDPGEEPGNEPNGPDPQEPDDGQGGDPEPEPGNDPDPDPDDQEEQAEQEMAQFLTAIFK